MCFLHCLNGSAPPPPVRRRIRHTSDVSPRTALAGAANRSALYLEPNLDRSGIVPALLGSPHGRKKEAQNPRQRSFRGAGEVAVRRGKKKYPNSREGSAGGFLAGSCIAPPGREWVQLALELHLMTMVWFTPRRRWRLLAHAITVLILSRNTPVPASFKLVRLTGPTPVFILPLLGAFSCCDPGGPPSMFSPSSEYRQLLTERGLYQ